MSLQQVGDFNGDGKDDLFYLGGSGVRPYTIFQNNCPSIIDSDKDGDPDATDCAPNNPAMHHSATDIPDNGIDENCDGFDLKTWFQDKDGDSYGNPAVPTLANTKPTAYVADRTDCNDNNANEHPGQTWYIDNDGDGYPVSSLLQCPRPVHGFLLSELKGTTDCNDADAAVHSLQTFFRDADGDGYGGTTPTTACSAPAGYVTRGGDCNDANPAVNPGAAEVCDGMDNNCDGSIDDGRQLTFYRDADGDGYGSNVATILACTPPAGYVSTGGDCNDANPLVYPGSPTPAIKTSFTKVDASCYGTSDGSITVAATEGTPPYQYSKAPGGPYQSANNFTGLKAGSYTIYVKDSKGCDGTTGIISIVQPGAKKTANFTKTDVSCYNGADGSITVLPFSGKPPFKYKMWSTGVLHDTNVFPGLRAGSAYRVYIVDAVGCTGTTDLVSISQPPLLALTSTKKEANCTGPAIGKITVTATGGTPPYQYKIGANGSPRSSGSFDSLAAGSYTIFVKDTKGCTVNTGAISVAPPAIKATYTKKDVTCYNGADGSITVTPAGGKPPYKYKMWSTGVLRDTNVFWGLGAGSAYHVYIIDAAGCTGSTGLISILQPPSMNISYTKKDAGCSLADGSITVLVSSGAPPYLYSKSPGGPYQPSNTFPNLPAGSYTLHVKDAKGCVANTGPITINNVSAAGFWTRKPDLPGSQRFAAVGFSIGNKGYLGTGEDGKNVFLKDFWEYDPSTNTWTKKADFGGSARYMAVAFSIGSKGYIGTGHDYTGHLKDFWEYDPATNAWTQKADFAGLIGFEYWGFSIGNKGYVGSGGTFWEYNPATNAWTQKASPGGGVRASAATFTIGNKGYVGTGVGEDGRRRKDFWEYDPATDTWTQKADFSTETLWAVGFSIGNKGYISSHAGFWQYDLSTNVWTSKSNLPVHYNGVGFSIGSKGYVSTGRDTLKDLWEYSPTCESASSFTVNSSSSRLSRMNSVTQDPAAAFELQLSPNPSHTAFLLLVKSREPAPVQVTVTDMTGRVVHLSNGMPHQRIRFGEKLAAGTYLVEVKQGSKVKTTKAVKLR